MYSPPYSLLDSWTLCNCHIYVCVEEEEEEEENRMSEEAERQYQQNKLQTDSIVQTDQPETVSSSFVNINFEMEEDCEAIKENKQRPVSVPP